MRRKDYTNQIINGLLAIKPTQIRQSNHVVWKFKCSCGRLFNCLPYDVERFHTTGCGCRQQTLKKESKLLTVDDDILYTAWCGMRKRCNSPEHADYPNYGGRGITICNRWTLFENFKSDMGDRPSNYHSLDRIDVDGNYEPSNCRWGTPSEQRNNQRRMQ